LYKEEKRSQILVFVFDRDKCTEPDYDALEPLVVVPPDPAHEAAGIMHIEPTDPTAIAHEAAGSMHIGPTDPTAIADELEPDREPDMFDNSEEYVGVNDEGMYGSVSPTPQFAQPTDPNANSNTNKSESTEFVNV